MPDEDPLLRRMVDKIPAMLAYWDKDLRCRFANRAYEWWFGVTSASLIGKHIRELLGPLYPLNLPYIEGALRGERQEFQREIPDPEGGEPRSSLASYIPDIVNGEVRGFVALVTDISEIKRVELARQQSEARFAGIVATSADAIVSIDQDQRITVFNDAAERTFGYMRAEVLGQPLDLLLPESVRKRHGQYIAALVAGPPVSRRMGERSANIVGRRKTGEEFPAEAAISKLEVAGKAQLTITLRDITERKQVELERYILAEAGAVLASSLSYQQTLKTIAQLIIHHIADLCVIDMLEDASTVHRVTVVHADPSKASVCEQLARLTPDRHHTLSASALDTGEPQVMDDIGPAFLEAIAQDPSHLELLRQLSLRSALAVPLIASRGLQGALVIGSARPHAYRSRDLGLATELARRASLAIENALLYEAEQRATRARDEALAIVAHDVRSPLGSILLAARTLEQTLPRDDPRAANSLRVILRSVERANHLIEDLLDVSRIDARSLAVARQRLAVRPLLEHAVSGQEVQAAAATLELQLAPAGELPDVWGDDHRLLQVLENLIGNAIKFTPRGGRIRIAAAPGPGEIVFSVADTGPGMAPEHLPRIFDRFWQAGRSERRGAGLGLAICKGIVEAHGGRIWVESTLGCGTTFFFTIPTAASAETSPPAPRPGPQPGASAGA